MEEKKIGAITHYFGHLGVGIIKIEQGELRLGDLLHFKGRTTDFQQKVDSMQIEHLSVTEAKPGQMVGMKVREHVREHDEVFTVVS